MSCLVVDKLSCAATARSVFICSLYLPCSLALDCQLHSCARLIIDLTCVLSSLHIFSAQK